MLLRTRPIRYALIGLPVLLGLVFLPTQPAFAAGSPSPDYSAGFVGDSASASTSSVSAEFVIPTVTCTTTKSVIAPGAGVASASGFIFAVIWVQCAGGKATYKPTFKVNAKRIFPKQQKHQKAAAGDEVQVSISMSSSGATATTSDLTNGAAYTQQPRATGTGIQVGDDWRPRGEKNYRDPEFTSITQPVSAYGEPLESLFPRPITESIRPAPRDRATQDRPDQLR